MVEVSIGKIKEKFEKVRSLEEKRLVLEWVKEYLQYLRTRWVQLKDDVRRCVWSAIITVPHPVLYLRICLYILSLFELC